MDSVSAEAVVHHGLIRYRLRVLRLVLHLFLGLAICAFLFPLTGREVHQRHIRNWSRKILRICGVQLHFKTASGLPEAGLVPNALLICNHISWLDIFVINSVRATRFVAKSDIAAWPLMGWLCKKSGTIFIDRSKPRDVLRILKDIGIQMQQGEQIAFFPEGTTAPIGTMLPFHANLFEAALASAAPLQPCVIRYLNGRGELNKAAEFIGEASLRDSLKAIVYGEPLVAELTALPLIQTAAQSRRELATQAFNLMADALEQSGRRHAEKVM